MEISQDRLQCVDGYRVSPDYNILNCSDNEIEITMGSVCIDDPGQPSDQEQIETYLSVDLSGILNNMTCDTVDIFRNTSLEDTNFNSLVGYADAVNQAYDDRAAELGCEGGSVDEPVDEPVLEEALCASPLNGSWIVDPPTANQQGISSAMIQCNDGYMIRPGFDAEVFDCVNGVMQRGNSYCVSDTVVSPEIQQAITTINTFSSCNPSSPMYYENVLQNEINSGGIDEATLTQLVNDWVSENCSTDTTTADIAGINQFINLASCDSNSPSYYETMRSNFNVAYDTVPEDTINQIVDGWASQNC